MNTHASQAGLMPTHLEAIGLVVTEWSHLESTVAQGIWGFTGIEEKIGRVLTTNLRMVHALNFLIRLGHTQLGPKERQRLRNLAKKISDLEQERNDIVHGRWKASGQRGYVIVTHDVPRSKGQGVKIRKFIGRRRRKLNPTSIHSIAEKISSVSNDLKQFLETIHALPVS